MLGHPLEQVDTLAFDIFGTVLDLAGSLVPPLTRFLESKQASVSAQELWAQWRARQRIEQYQDNLLMLGHSGYLETCRRAFVYCLRLNGVRFTDDEVAVFMQAYHQLRPFDDAVEQLPQLGARFKLVALSNGEQRYLETLIRDSIGVEFDAVISAERAGLFKPHPAVYRAATRLLGKEPAQIMMVAAHSFDILGARASGYRAAYVNRYNLPMEDTPYQPDIEVKDFAELATRLLE